MPRKLSFAQQRQVTAIAAAAEIMARSRDVAKLFGEEPYNSPRLTPEQQQQAYAKIRNDPNYLNNIHSASAMMHNIPQDAKGPDGQPVLDREAIMGLMADEAKHRLSTGEWTQQRYDQAVRAMKGE